VGLIFKKVMYHLKNEELDHMIAIVESRFCIAREERKKMLQCRLQQALLLDVGIELTESMVMNVDDLAELKRVWASRPLGEKE
jgi:hypothetical protein